MQAMSEPDPQRRCHGRLPTIPRWNVNKMPLTFGVAGEVATLRGRIDAAQVAGRGRGNEALIHLSYS